MRCSVIKYDDMFYEQSLTFLPVDNHYPGHSPMSPQSQEACDRDGGHLETQQLGLPLTKADMATTAAE